MAGELTIDDVEKRIASMLQILSIERAEDWRFPEISPLLWKSDSRMEEVKYLEDYLRRPYILDDFEEHSDRREWEKTAFKEEPKEVKDYWLSNCIGGNIIGNVRYFTQEILDSGYAGTNKPEFKIKAEEIIKHIDETLKDYREKPSQNEKVNRAKQLKKMIRGLLIFLSEQQPPDSLDDGSSDMIPV